MTHRWLDGLKTRSSARHQARHGRRKRPLIWLEGLEERVVLSATIYTVNSADGGSSGTGLSGTLPYVIGLANSNTNVAGSEIEFDPTVFSTAAPATITLASTLELSETAGPEVIDGPGSSAVTVSGANGVEVFEVGAEVTATLDGLTIADGTAQLTNSSGNGGGISNDGTLTVDDCTVTLNFAEANGGGIFNTGTLNVDGGTISDNTSYPYGITGGHGAGIYNDGGTVRVSAGCDISDNHALYQGGGIWSDGSLRIAGHSTVDNNTAPDGDGGGLYEAGGTVSISGASLSGNIVGAGEDAFSGGGIYVAAGTLTLTGSTLTKNLAENSSGSSASTPANGGGLCNVGGHVNISKCDVSDNSAQHQGGGVANTGGSMFIDGSTISGNTSVNNGGGVYVNGGTLTIEGSTIAANIAGDDGGGVANAGTVKLINCTITANSASAGGGIWSDGLLTAVNVTIVNNKIHGQQGSGGGVDAAQPNNVAAPTIDNTIVGDNSALNHASNPVDDDIDGTVSGSCNLIGNGGAGTLTAINGNQIGVNNLVTGTLANNGGGTETIALLPGSPAIGAGSDSVPGVPTTDQRGVVRPSDSIDVGAFQDQGFTLTLVNGGSPQSTPVNTAFTNALTVNVSSPAGDPVAGGIVSFATPSGGASASLSTETATINSAGAAGVTATANGGVGGYDVTASTLGAASPALFALTNTTASQSLVATTTTLKSSPNPSILGQSVTFTATVGPTTGSGTPIGTVTFSIDGEAGSPVVLTQVDGKQQASVILPNLAVGSYTVTASYNGGTDFAASASGATTQIVKRATIVPPPMTLVSTDGPTVNSVLRYGYHMMPTTVVLVFDQALEAITAEDTANYRIIGPDGGVIRVKSADYDPATQSVTLHFRQRISIHHTYKLTIDGTAPRGLTSTAGLLLDGTDTGRPDSDYHTSLTGRNLVLDPPWPRDPRVPNLAFS